MATNSIRVLIVDDFEPFRRFVSSIFQNNQELLSIAEAADGLEAIELAQSLQPDVIVLDIGLPKLNGIAAARKIRALSPRSKILFVSQESSVDVAQEAFSVGALGYVVKMDAGRELSSAVKAVLRGERFVGIRFAGHGFTGPSDPPTQASAQEIARARRHEVGFYSDDQSLLADLTQFIRSALNAGQPAVVVATESHRKSLLTKLRANGPDIVAAIEQGRYIQCDAAEALSTFMIDDRPDSARFLQLVGDLLATAAESANGELSRVAIFGECVQLLWAQGNAQAAIEVERLWNQLTQECHVDVLCAYSPGSVRGGMESGIYQQICAEHTAVHSR